MVIGFQKLTACCLLILFSLPLLSGQNDTLDAKKQYYAGKDFYYEGDYKAAKTSFLDALALFRKIYGEEQEWVMKAYYQLGRTERRLINFEASLSYLEKGLAVGEKLFGYYSEDVGYLLQSIGNTYDEMYHPKKASWYYNKSIAVFEKVYGVNSLEVGGACMNLGLSFADKGLYQKAAEYYQRALDNFKISAAPNSKAFNKIYINWSGLYQQLGEYDKAIAFGEKALEVKLMNYDELHPSVPKYYGNIGSAYQMKGAYREALPYFEKMLELFIRSVGPAHPDTGRSYADLGGIYVAMGKGQKGLNLYQKGLAIMQKKLAPTDPSLINVQYNMAKAYEVGLKDYDKALEIYQASLDRLLERDFAPAGYLSAAKRRMAKVYFEKGAIDQALLHIQQALQYLAPVFSIPDDDLYSNPGPGQTEENVELLKVLALKAELLQERFNRTRQITDLKSGLGTLEVAVLAVEKMRKAYLSASSRQFLNEDTHPIYASAVQLAFDLFERTGESQYRDKAFLFSEKNKASILWQSINEQYAFEASGVPSEVLDSINTQYRRIAFYEKQLEEAGPLATTAIELKTRIFDLKLAYEKAIQTLERSYPEYYQLKYAQATASPAEILRALPNDAALIEYFYTDSHLYTFVFCSQSLKSFRTPLSFDLKEAILRLRQNSVEGLLLNTTTSGKYIEQLNQLHTLLIGPIQPHIEPSEHLIIIPHGALQYLPFEMLAKDVGNGDFKNLDYLVKKQNIHYAWSAALWSKRPASNAKASINFAGFAPGFGPVEKTALASSTPFLVRSELSALPHSVSEIQGVQTFFPGMAFTNDAATEAQFLQVAPRSRIIHLATHGIVNGRFPLESGLFFSNSSDTLEDGFLSAAEIYTLNLPADLAVMSACNTGYGQLAEGEGVMSLGRAFMYAGCKSVIMSLWPANDQSTSTVLKAFYKYSAEGLSKNQALRHAKLDYLSQADPLTAHPYFWANLVLAGDRSPLRNNKTSWFWWIPLWITGLVFSFFFWKRNG